MFLLIRLIIGAVMGVSALMNNTLIISNSGDSIVEIGEK